MRRPELSLSLYEYLNVSGDKHLPVSC